MTRYFPAPENLLLVVTIQPSGKSHLVSSAVLMPYGQLKDEGILGMPIAEVPEITKNIVLNGYSVAGTLDTYFQYVIYYEHDYNQENWWKVLDTILNQVFDVQVPGGWEDLMREHHGKPHMKGLSKWQAAVEFASIYLAGSPEEKLADTARATALFHYGDTSPLAAKQFNQANRKG